MDREGERERGGRTREMDRERLGSSVQNQKCIDTVKNVTAKALLTTTKRPFHLL